MARHHMFTAFSSSFSHYLSVQSQYFLTVHRMLILYCTSIRYLHLRLASVCRGYFSLLLGPQLIHHLLRSTLLNVLCKFHTHPASRSQKPFLSGDSGVSVSNMRAGLLFFAGPAVISWLTLRDCQDTCPEVLNGQEVCILISLKLDFVTVTH